MQELDYAGIGMRIWTARKEKGLSQDEFAKECGICLSFLGHIERGTRRNSWTEVLGKIYSGCSRSYRIECTG